MNEFFERIHASYGNNCAFTVFIFAKLKSALIMQQSGEAAADTFENVVRDVTMDIARFLEVNPDHLQKAITESNAVFQTTTH